MSQKETRVELDSPYGCMKPFMNKVTIDNGTEGTVRGKINPTKGNPVEFDGLSHLGEIMVPSHWLKILEDDGNDR